MGFGTVYSITCNETGKVYVGATTIGLNQRISSHVCLCNRYDRGETVSNCSSFDIIRKGNYKITVLEHLEFTHKSELHQRERHFIAELGAINTMRRPNITKEEKNDTVKEYRHTEVGKERKAQYDKKYREGPAREELLAKKREYHHANKEAIAEKSKAYREANAEAIKEKKKAEYLKAKENGLCEIITCECGGTFTHRSKARHCKTKKHQDFINKTI
tara:strand:+ start:1636 stop:2286 length:651 start_codon:yes stop_codon:yes gene_type:complete